MRTISKVNQLQCSNVVMKMHNDGMSIESIFLELRDIYGDKSPSRSAIRNHIVGCKESLNSRDRFKVTQFEMIDENKDIQDDICELIDDLRKNKDSYSNSQLLDIKEEWLKKLDAQNSKIKMMNWLMETYGSDCDDFVKDVLSGLNMSFEQRKHLTKVFESYVSKGKLFKKIKQSNKSTKGKVA